MPKFLLFLLKKGGYKPLIDSYLISFCLSGALRAGSGVQTAIKSLADDAQSPLAQELSLLLREQRLGCLDQCLQHLVAHAV